MQAHHHFLWQLAECVFALHDGKGTSAHRRGPIPAGRAGETSRTSEVTSVRGAGLAQAAGCRLRGKEELSGF